MKEKNITIPEALFWRMAVFCLNPYARTPENEKAIEKGVYAKIDRMAQHDLYTRYKTAPTDAEKEAARREYLERAGIAQDFIWETKPR